MKRRLGKNNSGMTLVEMIIVLAIIVIASTMSMVTVTIIHSARCKDAALTVDQEIGTLQTQCQNMNARVEVDSLSHDVKGKDAEGNALTQSLIPVKDDGGNADYAEGYCILLCYQNNRPVLRHGYYTVNPNTCLKGTYNSGNTGVVDNITYVLPDSLDDVPLSSSVKMSFQKVNSYEADSATASEVKVDSDHSSESVLICFDGQGRCIHGYGIYGFYKRNGDDCVAKDYVRANGSHQSR